MENLDNRIISANSQDTVRISTEEAEEFRAYKRFRKIAELTGAIARSSTPINGIEDMKRLVERAVRFHQAAVKVSPAQLAEVKTYLAKSKVKVDCMIGGSGETAAKVKAYEARFARRAGASELTLVLSPSAILTSRYGEIQKEIQRVKRAAKGARLKVWLDKKYPFPTLARMARLCSDMGVSYVSVPYFAGCERLRYDLFRNCGLEVSEVDTFADFKKMAGAGVERIVTSRVSDIHAAWMKEIDTVTSEGEKKIENAGLKMI